MLRKFVDRPLQSIVPMIWLLLAVTGASAYTVFVQQRVEPIQPAAPNAYTVSDIRYTLGSDDPQVLSGVSFLVTPNPGAPAIMAVRAKLVRSSANYVPCTRVVVTTSRWFCPFSIVVVAAADQLGILVDTVPETPRYRVWLPIIAKTQQIYLPMTH